MFVENDEDGRLFAFDTNTSTQPRQEHTHDTMHHDVRPCVNLSELGASIITPSVVLRTKTIQGIVFFIRRVAQNVLKVDGAIDDCNVFAVSTDPLPFRVGNYNVK